ncbi:hypothetical protein [Acidisphaera sp. S103]|uniref:hypothetical protein n=1 Tax=Acidisphaera sp. S103 TaxID=1747223 RepID=UPI00131B574A|nr:hypothetical protein [Acidisphaera sp. S103]
MTPIVQFAQRMTRTPSLRWANATKFSHPQTLQRAFTGLIASFAFAVSQRRGARQAS